MIALVLILLILFLIPLFFMLFALLKGNGKKRKKKKCGPDEDEYRKRRRKIKIESRKERKERFKNAEEELLEMKNSDGLLLRGRYYGNDGKYLAILIHGYRGSWKDMLDVGAWYYKMGFSIFIPSLRAHSESEGKLIGMGVLDYTDILSWISLLINMKGEKQICIHGLSMGAATAMMCAYDLPREVFAIVEDSGFTIVYDIFRYQLKKKFHLPAFPLLNIVEIYSKVLAGYDFKSKSPIVAVKHTAVPILFIHGKGDAFVPLEMAEKLFSSCLSNNKELLLIDEAHHADCSIIGKETYFQNLENFLRISEYKYHKLEKDTRNGEN